MLNKGLFLDRDGVVNIEKKYVYRLKDFEFIEGIFEGLKHFQEIGYLLFVITNQAGIARGYYYERDFQIVNNWMVRQFDLHGVPISKVYYCPYHPKFGIGPYKRDTYCRKPNPGMIFQAQREFQLDLSKSILVGDQETDIGAGIQAGLKRNILIQNTHQMKLPNTKANWIIDSLRDLPKIKNVLSD
jgi:D-glycero-D-manno-heptose 1,7-bisphosphate phosphatase